LVEDIAINQRIALLLLRKTGVEVDLACNGEEASTVFSLTMNTLLLGSFFSL
jgi:CheY-like chemotaxis protein